MSYFFSIIIPVYNTEKLLPRALDSILNQDFDINKIEVIVVNDASPKVMQCDEIIEKYSHICYTESVGICPTLFFPLADRIFSG